MSPRRALWPDPTAANGEDQSPADGLGPSRAVSPHVGAGAGAPGIASAADIRAECATGRDVGAVLVRMAELHEQLARAHQDLSGMLQNQLADARDSRLMSSVETRTRLLSIPDIAERLQLDARTVRRMRARRQLPAAIDLHGVLRWDEATIDAWLEGRRER